MSVPGHNPTVDQILATLGKAIESARGEDLSHH